ncbi:hypothetical protein PR048_000198 [Dryococelus australis]|uniref:Uncharacterized protein n=1 Tax=Dryococelus australis TaxID=614101 RepID=A0ABQ9IEV7_9NEOP|nr:hypothetical protein PR048_000198 [Dryococelus australis]
MTLVGGFSRGFPISPALAFWRCYILTSITFIGYEGHSAKRRPHHSNQLDSTRKIDTFAGANNHDDSPPEFRDGLIAGWNTKTRVGEGGEGVERLCTSGVKCGREGRTPAILALRGISEIAVTCMDRLGGGSLNSSSWKEKCDLNEVKLRGGREKVELDFNATTAVVMPPLVARVVSAFRGATQDYVNSDTVPSYDSGESAACSVNSSRTRQQNGVASQKNIGTSFTNQLLVTFSPAGSPANSESSCGTQQPMRHKTESRPANQRTSTSTSNWLTCRDTLQQLKLDVPTEVRSRIVQLRASPSGSRKYDNPNERTPQFSAYWSLSCVCFGCCAAPGSYGSRKVFPCKSAIGSEACRVGIINCDPIAKCWSHVILSGSVKCGNDTISQWWYDNSRGVYVVLKSTVWCNIFEKNHWLYQSKSAHQDSVPIVNLLHSGSFVPCGRATQVIELCLWPQLDYSSSPPPKANMVRFPAGLPVVLLMCVSCRTMPLVGGFYRGSPVIPVLAFWHYTKDLQNLLRLLRIINWCTSTCDFIGQWTNGTTVSGTTKTNATDIDSVDNIDSALQPKFADSFQDFSHLSTRCLTPPGERWPQSLPSTVRADNQCAVNIVTFVHTTVESSLQDAAIPYPLPTELTTIGIGHEDSISALFPTAARLCSPLTSGRLNHTLDTSRGHVASWGGGRGHRPAESLIQAGEVGRVYKTNVPGYHLYFARPKAVWRRHMTVLAYTASVDRNMCCGRYVGQEDCHLERGSELKKAIEWKSRWEMEMVGKETRGKCSRELGSLLVEENTGFGPHLCPLECRINRPCAQVNTNTGTKFHSGSFNGRLLTSRRVCSSSGMQGRGKWEIPEKTPPTSVIVRHDSHMRESRSDRKENQTPVSLLASHHSDPGSIPSRVTSGFSHVRIVPDDTADQRVFSGYPVSPALSFRRCSILTSITLIGSQDLAVHYMTDQGEPGSIPSWVTGFSQVGIVPDDAVGRWVFSGISRFPANSFRRRSIFTSVTLIPSQDLGVKSRPNLFTHYLAL